MGSRFGARFRTRCVTHAYRARMNPSSLHFSIPDTAGFPVLVGGRRYRLWGLQVTGRAELIGKNLVLQLTLDSEQDRFRQTREFLIPADSIESMVLERRWFRPRRVRMRVRDLRMLQEVPGSRGGELTLQIGATEELDADDLIASVLLKGAELQAERSALDHPSRTNGSRE